MNREGGAAAWLRLGSGPLVAAGVLVGFAVVLAGVLRVGLPLWTLVVPIAALAYGFAVLKRPVVGLFVVICIFFVPLQVGGITLLQSVGVSTAGLILIWFLHHRRPIQLGALFLPLMCLGLLMLASLLFTTDSSRTMLYLRKWAFNMIFFLMLTNLVLDFRVLKRVIWAIMSMAVLNSVVGMVNFATTSEARYRSTGLLENENQFGNLAALAFPLALYQFLYGNRRQRWLGLVLSAILVGGVVVSVSRGALTALLTVFVFVVVSERKRFLPLALIVLIAAGAAPFLPDYFYDRVDNLVNDVQGTVMVGADQELTTRGHYNKSGLRVWMAHPILGVGVGNFGHYIVEREFNTGIPVSDAVVAHNIYLQALVEMGLLGLGVLLWLVLITLRNVFEARRRSRGDNDRWLYFGGMEAMALTVLVASFSTGNLVASDFWLLVSLTAVSNRISFGEGEAKARSLAEAT